MHENLLECSIPMVEKNHLKDIFVYIYFCQCCESGSSSGRNVGLFS